MIALNYQNKSILIEEYILSIGKVGTTPESVLFGFPLEFPIYLS